MKIYIEGSAVASKVTCRYRNSEHLVVARLMWLHPWFTAAVADASLALYKAEEDRS
jgi:hypothetical protein